MDLLVFFAGFCLLAYGNAAPTEMLELDNGLNRGDWGPPDICQDGWITSFEIKYAALGSIDDTAMTGIRMFCQDINGTLTDIVTSAEAKYGDWLDLRTCKIGQFINGMRANILPEQGNFGDDLGMDNIQVTCSDGEILDGQYGTPIPPQEEQNLNLAREHLDFKGKEVEAIHLIINEREVPRDAGEWGSWVFCSAGLQVCGVETRVERDTTLTDDAGVVDMIMFCCTA